MRLPREIAIGQLNIRFRNIYTFIEIYFAIASSESKTTILSIFSSGLGSWKFGLRCFNVDNYFRGLNQRFVIERLRLFVKISCWRRSLLCIVKRSTTTFEHHFRNKLYLILNEVNPFLFPMANYRTNTLSWDYNLQRQLLSMLDGWI